jgi:hypothetical protein
MVAAFLIAGALSIPVTKIWFAIKRRQERTFATEMKAANRLVSWAEVRSHVESGHGCLISDHLSLKGPTRLWWTSDDVPAVSPCTYVVEEPPGLLEAPNSEFDAWCRSRYTNPQSGAGMLVELRDVESDSISQSLTESRGLHRHVHV